MNNKNNDAKTFSDHKDVKGSSATEHNDAKLDIASDANDNEVFETALMQNIGMAMTEPALAKPGVYPLVRYPRTGPCAWKIDFHKGTDDWAFSFDVSPWVREMFMGQVGEAHKSYKHFMKTRKSDEEYAGKEIDMPPWIAQMVELETGAEFGSEEFREVMASNNELCYFWIDKRTLALYQNIKT